MDLPKNIILVGFMGAGKTTTGKELAHSLGFQFLDLDQFVEDKCGLKVAEIFKIKGEEFFRKEESGALDYLAVKNNFVISTGGGVWLKPENREKLLKLGLCVWLKVSPEKAYKRIEPHLAQRPLVASSANPLQTIQKLLSERDPEYAKAHVYIETDEKTPRQVTLDIIEIVKKDKPLDLRSMQK